MNISLKKILIFKKFKWFNIQNKLLNYFQFFNFFNKFIKINLFLINDHICVVDLIYYFYNLNLLKILQSYFNIFFHNSYYNYFYFFKIIGLGYRNRRVKRYLIHYRIVRIKLGFSHKIRYLVIDNLQFYLSRKRFLILSNDFNYLYNTKINLLSYRKLNDYKI